MVKIGLIGYGKMGKMIAQLAESKGCQVVAIIDPEQPEYPARINPSALAEADVLAAFRRVRDEIREWILKTY